MTTQIDRNVPVYVIAPGHSITTARGYLHDGEVVTERDFPGGKKQLESLVASKAIVATTSSTSGQNS